MCREQLVGFDQVLHQVTLPFPTALGRLPIQRPLAALLLVLLAEHRERRRLAREGRRRMRSMLALEQVRSLHLGKGGWVGDAREGRSLVRRQCIRVSWMGWMMLVVVVVGVGMLQVHTALLHA